MTQTLTIARMGHQGDGIAETPNGFVFVPGALPGEVISAEVKDGRVEAFDLIASRGPSGSRLAFLCKDPSRLLGETFDAAIAPFTLAMPYALN